MGSQIHTVAFQGIEGLDVQVQVQISPGMPSFSIVGLANRSVSEARERVRASFQAMGLALPGKRITVNLAPGNLPKEGSHYDLAIAVALLIDMQLLPAELDRAVLAMGELSLDGTLNAVPGTLPAAMCAFDQDLLFICPKSCGGEAAWVEGLKILAPATLEALIYHYRGLQPIPEVCLPVITESSQKFIDLQAVVGQSLAKKALEIAAAGGHNLLMSGPPGVGKSMLASCMPGILPPMEFSQILEVSMISSVAGQLRDGQLCQTRPFRKPHHSASMAALVGGGRMASPGEMSLAHHGVMFLDELPEFRQDVLDAMRQPLELGEVVLSRADYRVTYPARFQLIAAMNPCKCGYLADPSRACSRVPMCAQNYQARISGPLLDRFDIRIELSSPSTELLLQLSDKKGAAQEDSYTVRQRVMKARERQKKRFVRLKLKTGGSIAAVNACLPADVLQDNILYDEVAKALLTKALQTNRITARSFHRIIRLARTIADLEEDIDSQQPLREQHIAQALMLNGSNINLS